MTPRSPDLNSMEHVWDMIERQVRARNFALATLTGLLLVLQEDQAILTLIEPMQQCMKRLIRAH